MRRLAFFLTATAIIGLAGCTTAEINANDAAKGSLDYRTKIVTTNDAALGLLRQRGPDLTFKTGGFYSQGIYFVQRLKRQDKEVFSVMVNAYNLSEWAFFQRGFADGAEYPTYTVDKKVMSCGSYGCNLQEIVAVDFTPEQFGKFATTGLSLAVTGTRGRLDIYIPHEYVSAMIAAASQ